MTDLEKHVNQPGRAKLIIRAGVGVRVGVGVGPVVGVGPMVGVGPRATGPVSNLNSSLKRSGVVTDNV